jgi:hypothetical protein
LISSTLLSTKLACGDSVLRTQTHHHHFDTWRRAGTQHLNNSFSHGNDAAWQCLLLWLSRPGSWALYLWSFHDNICSGCETWLMRKQISVWEGPSSWFLRLFCQQNLLAVIQFFVSWT